MLPGGFRFESGAAASRAGPDGFMPRSALAATGQARAAHRGHIRGRGRVLDAIGGVAGTRRDGDSGMIVVGVISRFAGEFGDAVAIRDRRGPHPHRRVDGSSYVGEGGGIRFHEQDVAIRAGGREHVQIQGDFRGPSGVEGRHRARALAQLVHFGEASASAGRKPELGPVDPQIGGGGRGVVRIDDGDGMPDPPSGRGQAVGGLQIGRRISARCRVGAGERTADI